MRFSEGNGLKIPQIGWNQLEIVQPRCPLFRGIPAGSYVYFVHSFFPKPVDASIVATRTTYGETFASSVWRDNVFATQFHPEKSQKVGLQLLQNFVGFASRRPRAGSPPGLQVSGGGFRCCAPLDSGTVVLCCPVNVTQEEERASVYYGTT